MKKVFQLLLGLAAIILFIASVPLILPLFPALNGYYQTIETHSTDQAAFFYTENEWGRIKIHQMMKSMKDKN